MLRRLLIAQGAAFVFFAAVIPVEVVYAKETLGAGDSGYGLMLASWGGGMVIGSLVFAAVRRTSLAVLLFFSTLAVGAGYLGLAVAPTLALACAASVLGGAGNGVQWVATISAVQEMTVAGMQARVMSVLESIGAAMPGVGFVLGGVVAAVASPRTAFWSPVPACSRSSPWLRPCLEVNGLNALQRPVQMSLTGAMTLCWS